MHEKKIIMFKVNKKPDPNKTFLNGGHAIPKATISVVINN